MHRLSFRLSIVLASAVAAGLMRPPDARAQERQEYKSTAPSTLLLRDDLAAFDGKEAQVLSFELPPGWVGGWHYHTADVFVYVQEGTFVVEVDGEGRKTFRRGQVYHEALNKVMRARNASTTERTTIIVFQVGEKGEPLMIQAEAP
jgi:quercetin dioxygenase-like cupin family protein